MRVKKPWPTKDAMQQIYDLKLWGGCEFDFYSGDGSHINDIIEPYIQVVQSFLGSFDNEISICDLGCGDFNVGNHFVSMSKKYIAIDIVPTLIARNKRKFQSENLTFKCLDIATDDLPFADCAIIRQVLQHLSNDEVSSVVNKLSKFKYVILTEHIPHGSFEANVDIISGQGIRIKKGSGLDITLAPFNFEFTKSKRLVTHQLKGKKGEIVTTLFEI
ncbi:MAG: class I SAM-dependent methyltransferase [Crocinitomicaceae bacterium]|nr:class I SAM-dependent methyltransferase [Crocinitomicaceae bacterium]